MNVRLINRLLHLTTCAALLVAIAVNKNGKIAGHAVGDTNSDSVTFTATTTPGGAPGDTVWLSSTGIADKVIGYAGTTPVRIAIVGGHVAKVVPLDNDETPSYFASLNEASLFDSWNGLTPNEAVSAGVDAVSGATYSSMAVIKTVRATLGHYADSQPSPLSGVFSWKLLITLLVIACAVIVPIFYKSRTARYVQLAINVAVIGFWSHSFISMSLIVNTISNGFSLSTGIIPAVLLIIGFIFPLFGKESHYCNHVCPLGSLHELAGAANRRKLRLSPTLVRWLNAFREALWIALLLVMAIGAGFDAMNYEAFSIFMFTQADTAVMAIACVSIILSVLTPRPYCRFVCPTGSIMKFAQSAK